MSNIIFKCKKNWSAKSLQNQRFLRCECRMSTDVSDDEKTREEEAQCLKILQRTQFLTEEILLLAWKIHIRHFCQFSTTVNSMMIRMSWIFCIWHFVSFVPLLCSCCEMWWLFCVVCSSRKTSFNKMQYKSGWSAKDHILRRRKLTFKRCSKILLKCSKIMCIEMINHK